MSLARSCLFRAFRVAVVALAITFSVLRAPAQAGDLYHYVGWQATMSLPNETILIALTLMSDGQVVNYQTGGGFGFAEATVDATFPARPTNREVVFHGDAFLDAYGYWWPFAVSDDQITVFHSGKEYVDFVIAPFIPDDWMGAPFDPADFWSWAIVQEDQDAIVTGADGRGFQYSPSYGSSGPSARASLRFALKNPAYFDDDWSRSPEAWAVESTRYQASTSVENWFWGVIAEFQWSLVAWGGEGDGHPLLTDAGPITQSAKGDEDPGAPMKIDWATADTTSISCGSPSRSGVLEGSKVALSVSCQGAPYFPLHSAGTAIAVNFGFTLTLTFGPGSTAWTISGCHDHFPAFEAYLGSSGSVAVLQTPRSWVWSMFLNCSTPFEHSGVAFHSTGTGELQ